jgi:two-component system response regulator NreC
MSSPIRILLADDHAILREGLRALLQDDPGMEVVGEADNGHSAVAQARLLHPDVIIMDISMPMLNGLEATRQIKQESPEAQVLILTMHQHEEYIVQVLQAGAAGYILKHAASSELVSAIRAVAEGGSFFSPSIARSIANSYVAQIYAGPSADPYDDLTTREREALQLVAEGYTNREIAICSSSA